MIDFDKVLEYAIDNSIIHESEFHGVDHWLKVRDNGLELAKQTKNADETIVHLFGLLHDFKREHDSECPDHGFAAGNAILEIRDTLLKDLSDEQFKILKVTIEFHNDGTTSYNPTIGCCWDADRLELPRVDIVVDKNFLSTDAAKQFREKELVV